MTAEEVIENFKKAYAEVSIRRGEYYANKTPGTRKIYDEAALEWAQAWKEMMA